MKKTSILKNFAYNLLYEFFLYFIPFIALPYASRVLGVDQLGRYSFAQSIVSIFVLFAVLGTYAYGQRSVAQLKNDQSSLNITFWELVFLRLITTALSLIVYALVILPLCDDIPLYIVASIELIRVIFDISWFYKGVENFSVISVTNVFCQIISLILIFVFLRHRDQLNLYVLINTGSVLIAYVLQWFFLKKQKISVPRFAQLHPFRHLRPVFILFIGNAAIEVYALLDKTMLGLIGRDNAQNGYYDQAQKIARVLVVIVTAIGPVIASRVAYLWKSENKKQANDLIFRSFRFIYALGIPAMLGLILIAPRFVPIFYGDGYEGVVPLLRVLSLLLLFIGTSNIIGVQYMVPTGKEKQFSRSLTLGAVVNFCLNSVFIHFFQAIGAAVASVIAEFVVTLSQAYFVRKDLPCKKIMQIAARYFLLGLGMFTCGVILYRILPNNIMGLILLVLICIGVYILELILLRDPVLRKDIFSISEEE